MSGSAELKWGSGLIGFSPIACLFFLVVTKRPELVIIAILGYARVCKRARPSSTLHVHAHTCSVSHTYTHAHTHARAPGRLPT